MSTCVPEREYVLQLDFQEKRGPAIAKFPLTVYKALALGSGEESDLVPTAWGHIFNLFYMNSYFQYLTLMSLDILQSMPPCW